MTRVAVTLLEAGPEACAREAAQRPEADLFEVRLDAWGSLDEAGLRRVRERIGQPLVATLRSREEGGHVRLAPATRALWLRRALHAGFDFLDIERAALRRREFAALVREARDLGRKVIVSEHLARPPRTLRLAARRGQVAKVAVRVRSWRENLALMRAARGAVRRGVEHVTVGMGDPTTRFLAPLLGSSLVYAAAREGREAAPGQVTAAALRERWAFWGLPAELPPRAKPAFVIGNPVGHSLSPAVHNAAYRRLGLAAGYAALEPPTRGPAFEALVESLPDLGALGANVTVPFKERAAKAADRLGKEAAAVGAANTLLVRGRRVEGRNTDIHGIRAALEASGTSLRGSRALVVGAGGAARAAVAALAEPGSRLLVTNRTAARAKPLLRLASRLGGEAEPVPWPQRSAAAARCDVVVQCTTVGLRDDDDPLPGVRWSPRATVLDLVYDPPLTPLLDAARAGGARIVSGLEVLLRQGAEAFRLMTGRAPPIEDMRRALEARAGPWANPSSPRPGYAARGRP